MTEDVKADIPVMDRDESIDGMEPLLIAEGSRHRTPLTDLALDLTARSAGFRRSLPAGITSALADLVRAMNCYYSNLIEGHDTHPIDIERALKNDYSEDAAKRDLQVEAKAHIAVQQWIDEGGLKGRSTSVAGLKEIHARFIDMLPDSMRRAANPHTGKSLPVVPGEFRMSDVQVGLHTAISPGAVPRFMRRLEEVYSHQGRTDAILGAAAAHHRFVWIHPFVDGNGRVARLMSHATLLEILDTGGIWSVARGLARNVDAYKGHLRQADLPRRNDLDGRGNLSEEGLAEFIAFFLETCIDQIKFMEYLVQPDRLRTRILLWAEKETRLGELPPKAGDILSAVLYRGELPRGDVAEIVRSTDRHARRLTSQLLGMGVLTSSRSRDPLRLAFPATLASHWMPGLFPDQTD